LNASAMTAGATRLRMMLPVMCISYHARTTGLPLASASTFRPPPCETDSRTVAKGDGGTQTSENRSQRQRDACTCQVHVQLHAHPPTSTESGSKPSHDCDHRRAACNCRSEADSLRRGRRRGCRLQVRVALGVASKDRKGPRKESKWRDARARKMAWRERRSSESANSFRV
jgi:hypothetical protein